MMKNSILFFLLAASIHGVAHSPDYNVLLKLFVDEKYEKVLYKAENYTLSDDTKKDALPYLFMSMSFFEIAKIDAMKEKYPDAFKNSLKYASKYGQKDVERAFVSDYEDYFAKFRKAVISEAETFMDNLKFTKAKSYYDCLVDLDKNDAGAHLMMGMVYQSLKSKKESEAFYASGKKLISDKSCSMSAEQRVLLKAAIIRLAESQDAAGARAEAKALLDLGLEYFEDDKEYQVTYSAIAN